MNIIVTGSNGFIGSHVIKYLRDHDEYVIGLGRRDNPKEPENVDEYVSCNLDSDEIGNIFDKLKIDRVDAVIHLAADMRREPHNVEVVVSNCGGTQRLLEFCESNGIQVFLQLSSLPVIGHPVQHPITESHPLDPYTVYHITKHTEEMLAEYAYKYRGLRTASLRISAPIGPHVNPKTIFPTFIRNALRNEDIVLYGKGTRQQNYIHARDIAKALHLALYKSKAHGVYNLTGDLLISNRNLAETVVKVLRSSSNIVFSGKEDPLDEHIWDVSLEKIREDIGYEPEIKITDAILEYAEWLKNV